VTRFDDVRAMGRDPETFSSEPTIMIPDPPEGGSMAFGDHKMMLMMDPPQHTALRRLISREFTQAPATSLRPRVEALARQIVDLVIERGECDFVADIACEMPSYVIAELMGIPLDDGRKLYQLTETIHSAPEAVPEGAQGAAVMEMFTYAQRTAALGQSGHLHAPHRPSGGCVLARVANEDGDVARRPLLIRLVRRVRRDATRPHGSFLLR
jgi:cytochrome P450